MRYALEHTLFHAALPADPRVSTARLFGSIAGLVNGNMFCGLFARSAIAKLGPSDHAEAMALDGAAPFDPMGTGRVMTNTVQFPETILDEPGELRRWFRKAFDYAVTLPPKKKAGARAGKRTAKKRLLAAKKKAKAVAAKKNAVMARKPVRRKPAAKRQRRG